MCAKKSWKIPKEVIRYRKLKKDSQHNDQKKKDKGKTTENRRKTDNTMANRENTKGQTLIYKTLNKKLKIELHVAHTVFLWLQTW